MRHATNMQQICTETKKHHLVIGLNHEALSLYSGLRRDGTPWPINVSRRKRVNAYQYPIASQVHIRKQHHQRSTARGYHYFFSYPTGNYFMHQLKKSRLCLQVGILSGTDSIQSQISSTTSRVKKDSTK